MRKYGFLLGILFTSFIAGAQIGAKMNKQAAAPVIAGTWTNSSNGQTITLVLFDNGTGEFDGSEITYQALNGKLVIKAGGASTSYSYKLTGNSLTLSGGDLSKPVVFTKPSGNTNNNNVAINNAGAGNDLLGSWTAQGMQFTFLKNGKMMYNDKTMDYTVNGNQLYCSNAQAGVNVTYEYEVSQGHLLLRYNGNTMMLQKKAGDANPVSNTPTNNTNNKSASLFGEWVSNEGEQLNLMQGGKMTLNGYQLSYIYDANTITVQAPNGSVVFTYQLTANSLTVTTNGATSYYQRKGAVGTGAGNNTMGNTNTGGGAIDPSMVGKWSRMGASGGGYNSSGSSQYSEYFILNGDGTYEYHSESARSAYGTNQYGNEVYRGSAGGDSNDRGTWSVKGNILIANSQTKGTAQYPFQKRNNKNGDPMIVIDGTEYVTFYKKPAW
jgi:hypothetical protein